MQQLGTQSRQASQGVDKLGNEARESAREVGLLGDQVEKRGRGTTRFTGSTDGIVGRKYSRVRSGALAEF